MRAVSGRLVAIFNISRSFGARVTNFQRHACQKEALRPDLPECSRRRSGAQMERRRRPFLPVMPNAKKTWRLSFRLDGRQTAMTFGAYPEISLMKARDKQRSTLRHRRCERVPTPPTTAHLLRATPRGTGCRAERPADCRPIAAHGRSAAKGRPFLPARRHPPTRTASRRRRTGGPAKSAGEFSNHRHLPHVMAALARPPPSCADGRTEPGVGNI